VNELDFIMEIKDFFTNPESVREELSKKEFKNRKLDAGMKHAYPGTNCEDLPEGLEQYMMDKLSELSGVKVWKGSRPTVARKTMEGEESDIQVHTDRDYGQLFQGGLPYMNPFMQWAVLIHLTRPEYCQGGVTFCRSKRLADNIAFPLYFEAEDDISHIYDTYQSMIMEDYLNPTPEVWEDVKTVEMEYNKAIIFPAHYFHKIAGKQGFGDNFENCRLLTVGWFYTDREQL
jgi:hypothetical protein